MTVMSGMSDKDSALIQAETALNRYLDSGPVPPLKAFTLGLLSRIRRISGDKEGYEEKLEEANTIDPYFSKASGVPSLTLFIPPDEISYYFSYYSRPF